MASKLEERLALLRSKGLATAPSVVETSEPVPVDINPEVMEEIVETAPTTAATINTSNLSLKERLALLKQSPSTATQIANKPVASSGTDLKAMVAALRSAPELSAEDHEKAPAETHSLRERIWRLQIEANGESLRHAMKELQVALLENPTATAFFLPEDYGEMVMYIRRLTGNAVAQALSKPAAKGRAKTPVPQAEISLDELSF